MCHNLGGIMATTLRKKERETRSLHEIEKAFLEMGIPKEQWKQTYEPPEPIDWPWHTSSERLILSNNSLPPRNVD